MKLNSKLVIFFIFFYILMLVFANNFALAEDEVLLEVEDPVNDDYGPGYYQYPTNDVFQQKGLFDIKSFSIRNIGDKYQLEFAFSKLTDPWQSNYGFSLPLIELYFGNKDKKGSVDLYREGANVRLDSDYPWNELLKISGWWVRAYQANGNKDQDDVFWDAENNPADLKDAEVNVHGDRLTVLINKDLLGDLENSYVYLLIGSFDPFGPDHFRTVKDSLAAWNFSDLTDSNLEYAPRVLDTILPKNIDQSQILGNFTDNYPVLVPLHFKQQQNRTLLYLPLIIIILILLILGLFLMNKKPSITNNK